LQWISGPSRAEYAAVVRIVLASFDYLCDAFIASKPITRTGSPGVLVKPGHVPAFLASFCFFKLTRAALHIGASAQALRYAEIHSRRLRGYPGSFSDEACTRHQLTSNDETMQRLPAVLQAAYRGLDEFDGVAGVSATFSSSDLEAQVVEHISACRWSQALSCYERLLQQNPREPKFHFGLSDCLMTLGQFETAAAHLDGLDWLDSSQSTALAAGRARAYLHMASWDRLDTVLKSVSERTAQYQLGTSSTHAGQRGTAVYSHFTSSEAATRDLTTLATVTWISKFSHTLSELWRTSRHDQVALLALCGACASLRHGYIPGMNECLDWYRKACIASSNIHALSLQHAQPLVGQLHLASLMDFTAEALSTICTSMGSVVTTLKALYARFGLFLNAMPKEYALKVPVLEFQLSLQGLIVSRLSTNASLGADSSSSGGGGGDLVGDQTKPLLVAFAVDTWGQISRLARREGMLQTAYTMLLRAPKGDPYISLEQAKVLWSQDHHVDAMRMLSRTVQSLMDQSVVADMGHVSLSSLNVLRGKMLLRLIRWMITSGQRHGNEVISRFKQVQELRPDWEKSYFFIGQYYNRVLEAQAPGRWDKMIVERVIGSYGQSLTYGCRFIFESLPRLLTLWFEWTRSNASATFSGSAHASSAQVASPGRHVGSGSVSAASTAGLAGSSPAGPGRRTVRSGDDAHPARALTESTLSCLDQIQDYQLYTACAQLVSNIAHPVSYVYVALELLLARLLRAFPMQMLWCMLGIRNSENQVRSTRCQSVWKKASSAQSSHANSAASASMKTTVAMTRQLISHYEEIARELIQLCNLGGETDSRVSIRSGSQLLQSGYFHDVLVPAEQFMTCRLPGTAESLVAHDALSETLLTVDRFESSVVILSSLARPKKARMIQSDGQGRFFLCKPQDDLRKDYRMMEFNTMVNRFLQRDGDCRRRQLYIRTYCAIPLTEKHGIIEWVDHVQGLRPILHQVYRALERPVKVNDIKERLERALDMRMKLSVFEDILREYPPVFSLWFRRLFPDATQWFRARQSYSRTTAVMSIVGAIVGLGDRHGENVLFDSRRGDCLHVDYSCLFLRGQELRTPEKVRCHHYLCVVIVVAVVSCQTFCM
jgi:tetratricopeptide (TPR) repeat protein